MKKNTLVISGLLVLCGFVAAERLWAFNDDVAQYIKFETSDASGLNDIAASMQIVHFNDRPGLYGLMGNRYDVNQLIDSAVKTESDAFEPVRQAWIIPLAMSTAKRCAVELHAAKLAAFEAFRKAAKINPGPDRFIDDAQEKSYRYFDLQRDCQSELRAALLVNPSSADRESVKAMADKQQGGGAKTPAKASELATSNIPPEQPAMQGALSLEAQYKKLEPDISAAGDDDATKALIDILSNPRTVADWRFLSELDKKWSVDCGDAAFCWSRVDMIKQAEIDIKKKGLHPPVGVDVKFTLG